MFRGGHFPLQIPAMWHFGCLSIISDAVPAIPCHGTRAPESARLNPVNAMVIVAQVRYGLTALAESCRTRTLPGVKTGTGLTPGVKVPPAQGQNRTLALDSATCLLSVWIHGQLVRVPLSEIV